MKKEDDVKEVDKIDVDKALTLFELDDEIKRLESSKIKRLATIKQIEDELFGLNAALFEIANLRDKLLDKQGKPKGVKEGEGNALV
jgi:hypothetical protein